MHTATWVLIILLGSSSSLQIQFATQEHCEAARKELVARHAKAATFKIPTTAVCVYTGSRCNQNDLRIGRCA